MPTFSVYVIELEESVCHRTACPSRLSGKPHVYVGETKKSRRSGSQSIWPADSHLFPPFATTPSGFAHGSIRPGGRTRHEKTPSMRKRGSPRDFGSGASASGVAPDTLEAVSDSLVEAGLPKDLTGLASARAALSSSFLRCGRRAPLRNRQTAAGRVRVIPAWCKRLV